MIARPFPVEPAASRPRPGWRVSLVVALAVCCFTSDGRGTTGRGDESRASRDQEAGAGSTGRYPIGERLVYHGVLRKGGLEVDAGTATFTVTRDEEGQTVLTACAFGEKFGYTLATQVTSVQAPGDARPATYHYLQRGSECRQKKLSFSAERAVYTREKHCMEPNCTDRRHFIVKRRLLGRNEQVHCPDRDCRVPAHLHWKKRHDHELDVRHFDMLSAVYHARTLDLTPGGDAIEVPVINDHDRWIVRVQAREGGRIKVAAGSFQTLKITLDPKPRAGTEPHEKFKGLFGLNGTIHVWLDKETKLPVLVQGKLPFAFLDLFARVELQEVGTADKPCQLDYRPRSPGADQDFDQ